MIKKKIGNSYIWLCHEWFCNFDCKYKQINFVSRVRSRTRCSRWEGQRCRSKSSSERLRNRVCEIRRKYLPSVFGENSQDVFTSFEEGL